MSRAISTTKMSSVKIVCCNEKHFQCFIGIHFTENSHEQKVWFYFEVIFKILGQKRGLTPLPIQKVIHRCSIFESKNRTVTEPNKNII